MKTKNAQKFQSLNRQEMREVMAGNRPSLSHEGATVMCNDGTQHPVSNCTEPEMTRECSNNNGWKICSGGS